MYYMAITMTFCHSIGEKRKEKTSSNSKDDPLSSLFHTVSLCPPWAVSNRVTELLLGIWKETFFANVAELYKAFEMWKLGYSQQEKIILSRMHWPIVNISTTQSYLHLNLFPLECRLHVRHSQMVFTASLHYSGPTWKNQEKNMDALDSPLNSCHPSQT